MSTIQLKCSETRCNFAKANAKIRQGAKFAMQLAVKQVALQMQMLSLNSIIENSGSDRIANAKANVQYERALTVCMTSQMQAPMHRGHRLRWI